MKKYIFKLFLLIPLLINAQNIHTGYHSNSFILQSVSNPAAFPTSNTIVGFPALSNLNYSIQWPLRFNDMFDIGEDDSLRLNFPSIVSNMQDKDGLYINTRHQLFHFGMKIDNDKKWFVYLGDELISNFDFRFSSGLLDYLTRGNAFYLNQQMDFSSEQLQASIYNSFYLGAAYNINDKWNLGARLKFLKGIANIHTEKFHASFFTDESSSPMYKTIMKADIHLKTSGLGMVTDSIEFDPMLNSGFAFDIGAIYCPNDEMEFSFALNDIGSINWNEENNQFYTTDGQVEYTIEGLNQTSSGAEDLENQIEEITDSLSETMELTTTSSAYTTKLGSNLFLGAKYRVNEMHSFSLLFHSRKQFDNRYNVYNLAYQLQLLESFQWLASYQNMNGISNIGSGFVWSPKLMEMHLMIDNIFISDVFDTKNFAIQIGFIFKFG